ncbi:MAG: hypothetical protein KAX49_20130, partial [Halanaerobiales bacterium]|nr:hypothetical protein [Halanaerobiales bacterium]
YDPEIGRFISSDPLCYGLNWYIYTSNNPLRFIDPSGLFDYDFSDEPDEYENLYQQYKPDPLGALGKPINKFLDFILKPIRAIEIDYDYYSTNPFYYRSLGLGYIEARKNGSELSMHEYGLNQGYIEHKYGTIDIYDIELAVDLGLARLGLDNIKDGFESAVLQRTMLSGSDVDPVQAKIATFIPFLSLSMVKKSDEIAEITLKFEELGKGQKYWEEAVEFKKIKVYKRNDLIDPILIDKRGRTNLQRMQKGLAPIGPDGNSINLHHMIQTSDSSIAELTQTFHKQNSSVIHINSNIIPSGINRSEFNSWKRAYWKNRALDFE